MLEVEGLCAGYGATGVLWDVGLTVAPNEVVALVGSNGAGKTTLLRAISGVIRPTAGAVRWRGKDLAGLPAETIVGYRLAHVPEGRRLFAGMTVRENLMLGAYRRPRAEVAESLDRVLALFPRLGERLGQLGGNMSGGEQQMCAIGRGLMSQPELIMIDELSLGLAPKLVDQLLSSLALVAEGGTSVLLVEQDVVAALEAASRGYVIETGSMVLDGSSGELLDSTRVREAYLGLA